MASLLGFVSLLGLLSSVCGEDPELGSALGLEGPVTPPPLEGECISHYKHEAKSKEKDVNLELQEECDLAGMQNRHARIFHQEKPTGSRVLRETCLSCGTGQKLVEHLALYTGHTSNVNCPEVQKEDTYFCEFPNSVLHRGANLSINVTVDGDVFQQVLTFRNSGQEGSGAVNFSCLIYNLRFMNCSWRPGPAAPTDVQYHLYAWTSTQDDDEVECPHYLVGPTGTHVGCHFDQLAKPKSTDNYFFLVNGTSQETAIQFLDFTPFEATQMEKYNPPANLTVTYNGSHHLIHWDNPVTRFDISSQILYYELDIQRKGSSAKTDPVFQRGSHSNTYLVPSSAAGAESTFRARVRHAYREIWSDWSVTLHFGLPKQDFRGTIAALVGLVVGAAALLITVLMFLCTRFSLTGKLFPRVPQVKRDVLGTFEPFPEVFWDEDHPPLDPREPEDILMVQEMRPCMSGHTESGPAPHDSEGVRPKRRALAV